MADVVVETHDRYTFSAIRRDRVILTGVILGLVVFVLTWLLSDYVLPATICKSSEASGCQNVGILAGNVAAVVAAIGGMIALTRHRIRRVLWIVLSVLIMLWSIGRAFTDLGAVEILAWTTAFYAVGYFLYSSLFRIRSLFVAVILSLAVILVFRWILFI